MIAKERDNATWLKDLQTEGELRDGALSDLRAALLRSMPRALSSWLSPGDPHFETLLEDTVQQTLVQVLDRLESFEGRSQFLTWVYKIAVRQALNELRRRRWRDVSLDELENREPEEGPRRQFASGDPDPETTAERRDAMQHVQRIIAEELTEKQRSALMAIGINGMAIEEVAQRMGTNRNALYKLLHDARVRLKQRLEREGLAPDELLGMFSRE